MEINIDSCSAVTGICYFFDKTLVQQMKYANTHSVKNNLDNIDLQEKLTFQLSCPNAVDNIPIHAAHTYLSNFLQRTNINELDKQQISAYLMLMAEYMVKHQNQTQLRLNDLDSTKSSTKKELYKRLQSGRQFIHDNIERPISLKEMAKAAFLSEYYFHRNFRLFFNQTPHQYHHAIRMQQAHHLLNQGKHSKKEVAFRCGFQDPKYFSKAYKKWTCFKLQN